MSLDCLCTKVIVNGKEHKFLVTNITYSELLTAIGFNKDINYTVTYYDRHSKVSSMLTRKETLHLSEDMVINIAHTGNS